MAYLDLCYLPESRKTVQISKKILSVVTVTVQFFHIEYEALFSILKLGHRKHY